jgi:hypothetical protein
MGEALIGIAKAAQRLALHKQCWAPGQDPKFLKMSYFSMSYFKSSGCFLRPDWVGSSFHRIG